MLTFFLSQRQSVSKDSHLVIVTVGGAARKPGEQSRSLALAERNVNMMRSIIPKVLKFSPNAAICIVSNPCDLLTAIAAKIAGPTVPPGRIFGSGTCLDSSRLRSLIAKRLELDAQSVTGYVIGEHGGDSSIPVWSSVHVGGVPILQPAGEGPTPLHDEIHREVENSACDVIEKKGYTNWAVGLMGAYIANAVLDDTRQSMPVSTCVRGMHGIETQVFLSMPCEIGSTGVRHVVSLPLTPLEKNQFVHSAKTIWGIQKDALESI
jgi:L-lactate dehydrogenase